MIEPAESWLEGRDKGNMITETPKQNSSGRSLLYPGVNYLILGTMEMVKVTDPFHKMLFNRFVHALYSLLIIIAGYRLALELGTRKQARIIGLLLALFWIFPEISVRTLVEVVPIPLLLLSSLWVVQFLKRKVSFRYIIFSGLLLAICFSLRYQTLLFAGGLGLGLVIERQWKATLAMGLSTLLGIGIIHGIGDYFLCGSPFCKVFYYINYNINHANDFTSEPWHFYLLILLGVFIPPLSIMLMTGFFRSYKVSVSVWLAVLVFLLFHSIFPNKEERFIFTIMPHLLILGYLGWEAMVDQLHLKTRLRGLIRFSWRFFWLVNIPMVILYSAYDNKRARIEGMAYLGGQEGLKGFVLMDPTHTRNKDAPLYYGGFYEAYPQVTSRVTPDSARSILRRIPYDKYPNYLVLSMGREESREEYEAFARRFFPDISYDWVFEMGMIDAFRNKINKGIALDDWAIYRIEGDRIVPFDPDSSPLPNNFK